MSQKPLCGWGKPPLSEHHEQEIVPTTTSVGESEINDDLLNELTTSIRALGRIFGLPCPGGGGRWPVTPEEYILAQQMTRTPLQ